VTAPRATARSRPKRALDLVAGVLLLTFAMPLLAFVSVLVLIDSRGPLLYRAERVGFQGRRLRMLKFRKMHRDAAGPGLTTCDDERFTRVGCWLARLKLDELPQLWHVVSGSMSLIGPRPEIVRFVNEHPDAYKVITSVRPGLVGLSQLAFADESRVLATDDPVGHYTATILPQKVRLDLVYVHARSLSMDLRILAWAAVAVLLRQPVAVNRDTGHLSLRRR
jgi:lipopolysaccharide/colanic/teichoic acid biosynthesis glycosyltransferase